MLEAKLQTQQSRMKNATEAVYCPMNDDSIVRLQLTAHSQSPLRTVPSLTRLQRKYCIVFIPVIFHRLYLVYPIELVQHID